MVVAVIGKEDRNGEGSSFTVNDVSFKPEDIIKMGFSGPIADTPVTSGVFFVLRPVA